MQGRTILVIDDNDAVRTALDVLLTLEGARVETAVVAKRAGLERVARGGVDLVLQDMNFRREATSGTEGIELFHALRAMDPQLPVVLLTAWTNLETAVELVKAGAADYVAKPWDNARLVTTVRNLLQLRAALAAETERQARVDRSRAAARRTVRPARCRLSQRSDACRRADGDPGRARRRAGADHGSEWRRQGDPGRDHPGELCSARRRVRAREYRRAACPSCSKASCSGPRSVHSRAPRPARVDSRRPTGARYFWMKSATCR
jgi:FixJ family two-component response regulator